LHLKGILLIKKYGMMKKNVFLLMMFWLGLSFSFAQQKLNIVTYNIRFDNPDDQGNLWKDRSSHLISLLKFHQADIIGTQEGLKHQLEEIKSTLEFKYVGIGRDFGDDRGEFSAIFYNPLKVELLEDGTFWLSENPNNPSIGWDAALNRVCTWAKFKVFEHVFYVFNVHYDHMGQIARLKSSELVLKNINVINKENLPVILMGDFNVTEENVAYQEIIKEGNFRDSHFNSKNIFYGSSGTFNGFKWDLEPTQRIDYIFVSPNLKISRYGILTENYGKKYPSDHFPVLVEVSF
jgi:endonuclease/exonuclease/phosphatase family metal-dependent hydrolase